MYKPVSILAGVGVMLFATGCASVSVSPKTTSSQASRAPRRLVVGDFRYIEKPGSVRVDRRDEKLAGFEANLDAKMRADLVKSLRRFGLPVEMAQEKRPVAGAPGWLVTGEFTRVNQGSRALRVIVGGGAGGTKLETRVRVTDIRTGRLICAFRTTGGSNADSGIITSYGPLTVSTFGSAAINVIGASAHGLTEDARRTAKMIADYISQQLAAHGAIPAGKAREPKILNGPVDPLGSLRN